MGLACARLETTENPKNPNMEADTDRRENSGFGKASLMETKTAKSKKKIHPKNYTFAAGDGKFAKTSGEQQNFIQGHHSCAKLE